MALLGVALAGGCAVYDVPMIAGNPEDVTPGGNGSGGLHGGDGNAGAPADPNGRGGQRPSLDVNGGQGETRDSGGDGDTAGASAGGGAAGADSGAAGSGDAESQGGDGGAAGASGNDGSVGGGTSCAAGWRNQSACDQCATQTQPDLQACAVILDCYVSKSCGPSSCASTDQKCGPNVLREGAAAYWIARDVFACMCK